MNTLKDNLWIWGQPAGSHHKVENNIWNLPGENKMGAVEGAEYLGIPNICIVSSGDDPAPPFDNEAEKLKHCPKVAWSIVGDGSSKRFSEGKTDLEDVLKIAEKYPNIVGGVMDDFFRPDRQEVFTPEMVKEYAEKLHKSGLELWTVLYEHELTEEVRPYLEHCDIISFWTWDAANLNNMEENMAKVQALVSPDKKIYAGCYMWDYNWGKPMPMDLVKYQFEIYKKWFEEGIISGMVVCSNCIADLGIEAADYTREWILANAHNIIQK